MKEYIEREAAVNEVGRWLGYLDEDMILRIQIGVKKLPAADVRENVRGEWLINCDGYYPYCSHCKREPQGRVMTDFCPNCGAQMKEATE